MNFLDTCIVGEFNAGNYSYISSEYSITEGTAIEDTNVTVSFVSDFLLTAAQSGSADFLYGNASLIW